MNLMNQGAAIGQFQVHPLDTKHSVSLLQHYIPGLNASVARKLANHVGNFPQALIAIATSLQGNGSQNIDSVIGPMMSKLEEGDTYGFLVMTELDDSLGPPTLAYRRAYMYYHLTEEVKKCGHILAQASTRVFTPRIAEYWLQSYASPDEVTHCRGMLEERDVLSKLVVPSDNPSCALTVLYQFRSLYKECFTFEQKKIWYPALQICGTLRSCRSSCWRSMRVLGRMNGSIPRLLLHMSQELLRTLCIFFSACELLH